jgi:plasmid stabilization system protein ParE
MEARVRVDFSHSARQDLLDIVEWYVSQSAPEVGRRLVAQVIDRTEQLRAFPDSGRMVPEFDTPWLRELEMPPFRIVYRRDESVVTVVRVWRSERLMDPVDGNA